jgi:hypothetical protein
MKGRACGLQSSDTKLGDAGGHCLLAVISCLGLKRSFKHVLQVKMGTCVEISLPTRFAMYSDNMSRAV